MNVVELRNITKIYPGSIKKANNNITLHLKDGEILCIAGENGAGKTTLMKILCGLEKPDVGEIIVNGKIGMVHQHFMLFPEYTVAENIVIGNEPVKFGIFTDQKKTIELAKKIILENNFAITSTAKVSELTQGEKQQVEICRILNSNAKIIILDEPTSILTDIETQSLFKTLKTLVNNGKSIILITHKLNEVKEISDRVAVLRQGELIGVCDTTQINESEIAKMMIGETVVDYSQSFVSPSEKKPESKPVISFENVTVLRQGQKRPLLDNVSFSVYPGEILGFAGVGGNGLGVIEAVLGGFLHPASGKILHKGRDISHLSIKHLRKQGLAYVPADRINVGSAQNATIEENVIVNRRYEKFAVNLLEKYNIESPDINEKASTLSGGNLQKLILAREINCLTDYIVFSEPTCGLDIKSSQFVMKEIETLRKNGAAVILISTNLDEIVALTNRIVVMYRGKIADIIQNDGNMAVKELVGNCMQGLEQRAEGKE
ncbi:MAG: ATP-binding cassette domain-containing protein [Treponema sp.]|jgi:simple sugar transport system ATP-binding protein|nr:ATP-binding cassette domain-containing protein [Treponema sp.]